LDNNSIGDPSPALFLTLGTSASNLNATLKNTDGKARRRVPVLYFAGFA
jgi:hypothetical protein